MYCSMLNFLLRSLCTFHLANRTISVTRLSISLISHNSRTALHNTSILELRRECCRPFERYTDTQVPIHGHISQCAVPFAEALSLLLQAYIMSLSHIASRALNPYAPRGRYRRSPSRRHRFQPLPKETSSSFPSLCLSLVFRETTARSPLSARSIFCSALHSKCGVAFALLFFHSSHCKVPRVFRF
jgi:hypothetical protein